MLPLAWPFALALLLCALSAILDHRRRIIPDALTLPTLAMAPLVHAWFGGGWRMAASFLAALICFAPAYFLFLRGALGGGDVKLFAALGALLGLRQGLELQLTAFVLITGFVLVLRAMRGGLWQLFRRSFAASLYMLAPSRFPAPSAEAQALEMPMGGAIFAATVLLALRSLS